MKLAFALLLAASAGVAGTQTAQPYSGLDQRPIKALSAEEIDGLRSGAGLGFALTAELNGLPGPLHVVELADQLGLTPPQRETAQRVLREGKAEFARIGEEVVRLELALDQLFASGRATTDAVLDLSTRIGAARGALRAAHLNRHLEIAPVLDTSQRRRYAELRGYAATAPAPVPPDHGHHPRPHQRH